jgi:hypothetical protein
MQRRNFIALRGTAALGRRAVRPPIVGRGQHHGPARTLPAGGQATRFNNGRLVDSLTNDQTCGSFSDIKLTGACGIVAFDIGSFYFANFAMN